MEIKTPLILFDGVCNLCDSSVQFVIRNDKRQLFYFASLQGETGQNILNNFRLPVEGFNSFVLVVGDKIYRESTAALRVLKMLGGFWSVFYVFILVPPFLRDGVYRFISRNRYRWFGKKDACMTPTPDLRARFLL